MPLSLVMVLFLAFLITPFPSFAQSPVGDQPCSRFPVVEAPANYFWEADCSVQCETNASCQESFQSSSSYVYKPTSYWCYGFQEGQEVVPKCMGLIYKDEDGTDPELEDDKDAIDDLNDYLDQNLDEEEQDTDLVYNLLEVIFNRNQELTPTASPTAQITRSADPSSEQEASVSTEPTQPGGKQGNIQGTKAEKVEFWGDKILSKVENVGTMYCKHVDTLNNDEGDKSTYRSCANYGGVDSNGTYWCTNLVIDATRLAGVKGLTNASHQAVVNMIHYWKQAPDKVYLEYSQGNTEQKKQTLSTIHPGCAMFQITSPGTHTGREHVAIVKEVSYDEATGNGSIRTIDSNGTKKSYTFAIANNQIKNLFYPYASFGCYQ